MKLKLGVKCIRIGYYNLYYIVDTDMCRKTSAPQCVVFVWLGGGGLKFVKKTLHYNKHIMKQQKGICLSCHHSDIWKHRIFANVNFLSKITNL